MPKYVSAPIQSTHTFKYTTAITAIIAHAKSIARNTPKLCFTAAASVTQFKFGIFKLIIRPNAPLSITKITGTTVTNIICNIDSLNSMPSITLHITIGVIVIILWSFNFALKICQVSTGNVFAIHILFPSREIDGAVISFIDITAQIIKVIPKLRYTLLMPVRLMSLFISSILLLLLLLWLL